MNMFSKILAFTSHSCYQLLTGVETTRYLKKISSICLIVFCPQNSPVTLDNINYLYLFTIVSEQLVLRKLKYRKNRLNNNVKSYETILQNINGFRLFISLSKDVPTPNISGNASVAASIATCIGINCDAWEWGRGEGGASISTRHNVFQYNAAADALCSIVFN